MHGKRSLFGQQRDLAREFSFAKKELENVVRQGRGVPAVPLVLVGIEA